MDAPLYEIPGVMQPKKERFYLNIGIYGPPGAGKTTLAATSDLAEDMSPCLILDAEKGTLALTEPSVYGAKVAPDVFQLVDDNADNQAFALQQALSRISSIHKVLATQNHKYRTVVIDTLTTLQAMTVDVVAEMMGGKKQASGDVGWEEYKKATNILGGWIGRFRDLPMHTIWLLHEEYRVNQNKDQVLGPALMPALSKIFQRNVNVVGYLLTRREPDGKGGFNTDRRLTVQPVGNMIVKDNTPGGKLGVQVVNPTMQKIMDLIKS